jgi:alkylation response protein AidB-like acyl-CoA dehydrogenase
VTIIDRAEALVPRIQALAEEGEVGRTTPAELVDEIRRAGLYRIAVPDAIGGLELDPLTTIRIVERVSWADGSTGWTTLIGNSTAFFAWLEPAAMRDLVGPTTDIISTGVWAPTGQARPTGDGELLLDGRWTFNSGCRHATWFQTGIMVMDGDRPALRPDGQPDHRFAYFPAAEAEVVDTWHAAGLRGTGSHDVVVRGLRLPEAQTAMPFLDPPPHDGPLLRLGFRTMTAILLVGFPLGVARRALDEVLAVAPGAQRALQSTRVAEDRHAQLALGTAEAQLQSARAYVDDAFGDAWETVQRTGEASVDQQLRVLLAMQHAMDAAVSVVDRVHELVGGRTVLDGDPIGRCFRDIHAARQHPVFSGERLAEWARVAMGVEAPSPVPRPAVLAGAR